MCLCDEARGSVCTVDYTMRPCLKENNNYKTKQSNAKGGKELNDAFKMPDLKTEVNTKADL